jgi:ribonuclease P protein subunit POP4
MGYMSELLGLSREPSGANASAMEKAMPSSGSMHPKLLKADFHGSIMTGLYPLLLLFYAYSPLQFSVRQSKNPCLLGLSGIVIHETENAFKIVTKYDKLKGTDIQINMIQP